MADLMKARSALAGVLAPGRSGESSGPAGVTVQEQPPSGCAHVAARAASLGAVVEAMQALGLALPQCPGWSEGGGFRAVWVGPERWLVFGAGDVEFSLREKLGSLASVSDQSDSRVVLRLSGPLVREALAKGVPIDLHPRAFHTGDAAVTQVAHIGVTIWQLDDVPTYDLAVARSYAGSLAAWLIAAGAEHGLLVQ